MTPEEWRQMQDAHRRAPRGQRQHRWEALRDAVSAQLRAEAIGVSYDPNLDGHDDSPAPQEPRRAPSSPPTDGEKSYWWQEGSMS